MKKKLSLNEGVHPVPKELVVDMPDRLDDQLIEVPLTSSDEVNNEPLSIETALSTEGNDIARARSRRALRSQILPLAGLCSWGLTISLFSASFLMPWLIYLTLFFSLLTFGCWVAATYLLGRE